MLVAFLRQQWLRVSLLGFTYVPHLVKSYILQHFTISQFRCWRFSAILCCKFANQHGI